MINLKKFKGFALVQNDYSLEATRLIRLNHLYDVPLTKVNNKNTPCPKEYVPCGSVEWCSISLNKNIVPDYYPEWLSNHLHRKVWYAEKYPYTITCFIKPANKYKRFTGFIHKAGSYKDKKRKCTYWCSEVIEFENEWRYYVTNGKIICGEWYWGDEVNTPDAPKLNISIPENYSGALDFGSLKNGKIALVEAHHPFACGWYGKQDSDKLYFQWLLDGWEYMQNF